MFIHLHLMLKMLDHQCHWSRYIYSYVHRKCLSVKIFPFAQSCPIWRWCDKKSKGDLLKQLKYFYFKLCSDCSPHKFTTIDEILITYKGICSFHVYVKSKLYDSKLIVCAMLLCILLRANTWIQENSICALTNLDISPLTNNAKNVITDCLYII